MLKQVKKKWVKALRSGKYNQTRGYLKDDTGYCCLGVLCDISKLRWDRRNQLSCRFGFYNCYLPPEFREKVKLDSDTEDILVRMNDGKVPFKEIADWIEENL